MRNRTQIDTLVEQVQSNPKYQSIIHSFVQRLSTTTLEKGFSGKAAVKQVRKILHQVGGAYFRRKTDYTSAEKSLRNLPSDLKSDDVIQFCRKSMEVHTSTAERLPILGEFFKTTLAPIAPVSSILDLACGLNPLAIPWMPLSNEFKYLACDIYCDMMGFIQSFFYHFLICGKAFPADIIDAGPTQTSQVAFLLKALPCLEQLDKAIGAHLLENIQADHILISFPVRSLGGHHKGMPNFYRNHFFELVAGKNWKIHEFSFDTELAFLVTK